MSLGKLQFQADVAKEEKKLSRVEEEAAEIAEENQKKLSKRSLWGNLGKIAGAYLMPAAIAALTGATGGLAGVPLLATQIFGAGAGGALASKLSGKKLKDVTADVTDEGLFYEGGRKDLKTKTEGIFTEQKDAGKDIVKNLALSSVMGPLAGAAGKEVLSTALTPMQGPLQEGVDPSMWQKLLQSNFGQQLTSQLSSDFPMIFQGQDNRIFNPTGRG